MYYVNTLFTYVIGVPHAKLRFLEELRRGMLRTFPDFRKNVYFLREYDREQKKLVNLHMKSSLVFLLYYRALTGYRRLRGMLRDIGKK